MSNFHGQMRKYNHNSYMHQNIHTPRTSDNSLWMTHLMYMLIPLHCLLSKKVQLSEMDGHL